jgi:large repetitive protein
MSESTPPGSHLVAILTDSKIVGRRLSVAGQYGAFVNGIELDRAVASGVATPTAAIQLSTNDGQTWSTIASNVPINRFGQAQVLWTVNATSTGSTALIRVTSGKVTTTSQPFLLANGGTHFYVDDGSLAGNQYTTAIGNDANSGKSPAQPVAKVATQRVPDRTG